MFLFYVCTLPYAEYREKDLFIAMVSLRASTSSGHATSFSALATWTGQAILLYYWSGGAPILPLILYRQVGSVSPCTA